MGKALLSMLFVASLFACSDDGDSDDSNGEAGSSGSSGMDQTAFGAACTTAADCVAPTNYCAAPPGGVPFCTKNMTSCDEAPTTCPTGWPCLDLNGFGVPAIICERM